MRGGRRRERGCRRLRSGDDQSAVSRHDLSDDEVDEVDEVDGMRWCYVIACGWMGRWEDGNSSLGLIIDNYWESGPPLVISCS